MEQWQILQYKGNLIPLYEVSNKGQIRNTETGEILSQSRRKKNKNYLAVTIQINGKEKREFIHRLIFETFSEIQISKGYFVNHKDEDPTNNAYENLELLTAAQNDNYGTRNQRISESMKNNPLICEPVECVETGEVFSSIKEAQQIKGIENISRAIKRGIKAGGYHWKKFKKEDE